MFVQLKNNKEAEARLLQPADNDLLFHYFETLSAASKSRFGPHSFDKDSVNNIYSSPSPDLTCYIAIAKRRPAVVSYMVIKQGMTESDEQRYTLSNRHYDYNTTVTYAPSVADDWQNSGLGGGCLK